MKALYSFNDLQLLFGDDDYQVKKIREHLKSINPFNDPDANAHNKSLRNFSRIDDPTGHNLKHCL